MAQPTPLHGTVALVTGAARRVGRAIVKALAQAGCDVAIHYHQSETDAKSLATEVNESGRRACLIKGDLIDPLSWPKLVDQTVSAFGRLDLLINNASAFVTPSPDTLEAFDLTEWDQMIRTNLTAPVALCGLAAPHLKSHGQGNIVNLGDIAVDRPSPNAVSYSASKAGLAAMTKCLARALAPEIRVNAVAPGIAVFPEDYSAELRQKLVDPVPLQREGSPEEIAKAVLFLVTSAEYVTGQTLAIDGGRNLV